MNGPKKIGILGGTFDPPHLGHLKLATHFSKVLHLDELLLIPSGQPWQKDANITPAQTRLQMTEAAGIDLARAFLYLKIPTKIGIDGIEIDRAGPSYTIDTVKALRERFGSTTNLILLMGADSLIKLPTWNSWKDLLHYVNFAVASRPQHDLKQELSPEITDLLNEHQVAQPNTLEKSPYGRIYLDESLTINLSSSELRNRLKTGVNGAVDTDQIPSHTLEIITNLGLYQ